MPAVKQDKTTGRIMRIELDFSNEEHGDLEVIVESDGLSVTRNASSVFLTKFEVLQIQRQLGDICSTVWRDDQLRSLGAEMKEWRGPAEGGEQDGA